MGRHINYVRYGSILLLCMLFAPLSWAAEPIVLAVHPYKSTSSLLKAFGPMADYLSQKLGRDVKLEISSNYEAHVQRIGENRVDVAYMGPAPYVNLVKKHGQKPILARQQINGQSIFQGKIIIRQDSSITELAGLQGKQFAFGDPGSTMSHLVPRYMLIKAGVPVDKLAGHAFLGSHDNVALGVLAGDYDAGAVKEAIYEKYQPRGLKALATTTAIPEHLFVTRSDMDGETIASLRRAMQALHLSEQGRQILAGIKKGVTALEPAEDKDYDVLREVFSVLSENGVQP